MTADDAAPRDEVMAFLIIFVIIVTAGAAAIGLAAAIIWTFWLFPWLLIFPVAFAAFVAALAAAAGV